MLAATMARRDVVIVFGAAIRRSGKPSPVLRRRLKGAVEAGKRCRDPLYLVTGGVGRVDLPEADVMSQTLREYGVPATSILREPESRDTLEEVRRCAAILAARRDVRRVLVCTSRWHQPRCRLLLAMLGVKTRAPGMPGDRRPMGRRAVLYYRLREVPATLWDVTLLLCLLARGRGHLQPLRPLPQP